MSEPVESPRPGVPPQGADAPGESGRRPARLQDPAEVARRIPEGLRRLLGAWFVAFFRVEPGSGDLVALAVDSVVGPVIEPGAVLGADQGLAGLAVHERRVVVSEDLLADPRVRLSPPLRARIEQAAYRTGLALPLVLEDQVIGALAVGDGPGRRFDERDVAVARVFAEHAALALDHARLFATTARRLRETEALLAVGDAFATRLPTTEALRLAARAIARALAADVAGVYAFDAQAGTLVPVAGYHVPHPVRPALATTGFPLARFPFLGEAWATRRAVWTADCMADPRFAHDLLEGIRPGSVLFVPTVVRGEVAGGLFLAWWEPGRAWAEEGLRFVEGLARHVGLALENADLLRQMEDKLRESEGLVRLSAALSSTLEIEPLLRQFLRHVARVLDAHSVGVWRRDPATGMLEPVAGYRVPPALLAPLRAARIRIEETPLVQEAIVGQRPVVADDVPRDPRVPDELRRLGDLRTLLIAPILAKGEVVAAFVAAWWGRSRAVARRDLALMEAIGSQAGVALENARLYETAEGRGRRLATLVRVARRLTSGLDAAGVLASIAEAAAAVFEGEAGFRLLEGEDLVRVGATPGARRVMVRDRLRIGESLSGRVAATGEALVTGDLVEDPRLVAEHRAAQQPERTGALMCVPVRIGARILGTLHVFRERGYRFGPDALELAQALADQAAVAIENARLYTESENRRRAAEGLATVGAAITASLDVPTILDIIAARARELIGTERAAVALLDSPDHPEEIRFVARHGLSAQFPERMRPRHWRDGTTPAAIHERRPVASTDVLADPDLDLAPGTRAAVEAEGYRAVLSVPLEVESRVLGALVVYRDAPRSFSAEEVDLLQRLAAHAAIAIQNARLYAERTEAFEALERTQSQLAQAQKMEAVGRLAGGIAHDFNNLLTVILGRVELLRGRLEPGGSLRKHADLIHQATERAAALTRQLLAFSRKQLLQPEALDANLLVIGIERMLRRVIGEDVELVVRLAPEPAWVRADRTQLEQVLMNLVVNARDAMPHGGRLVIETAAVVLDEEFVRDHPGSSPGPHVVLAVADSGTGMTRDVLAHLFEPFFTTKGPGKGTGLGLATVYGIVKQSGGFVGVESEPGRGSRFAVYLPLTGAPGGPVRTPSPGATAERRGSETVLLVEDESPVRDLAREVLREEGYAVLEARDATEALEVAAAHAGPIHLLLTDVVMPRMNGTELAARLASRRPALRVLYMSGYTDDALGERGVLAAGQALLAKPFTVDRLSQKVRQVLDGPS